MRAESIVRRMPNGPSVRSLHNATSIRSADGQIESFVVTLQDPTPLAEQERLRAEFLAMDGHEVRAPLASIRGTVASRLDALDPLSPAETRT